MTSDIKARAELFHALHDGLLVLPNAWDAVSARLVVDAGARAVATTSAGVAWSLGTPDGDALGRDRAVDLIARVAAAVDVPVSADIEGGYSDTPDGVAKTVEGVLAAGAVGVNLEDAAGPATLRELADQAERIAAARRAADAADVPLFLNARIDTYLRGVGDPDTRLRDTLTRAAAYADAGASGIFVPAVTDAGTVAALAEGTTLPLNVMAGPGAPDVATLAELGVSRISLGSSIAQAAYAVVRRAARQVLSSGTYDELTGALDYGELNALSG
ncbi:isocitrate lyase/phosphoenolpyruvate mutase family protein [Actinoallomurus oryzae]|uniref:Isocitrate lyase/phosphoenolpyruvate mutase family protein n=1 Tax=Actinoallomurus oryzae TaxID=502180 RepID=A0ABP8QJI7_9ACTN